MAGRTPVTAESSTSRGPSAVLGPGPFGIDSEEVNLLVPRLAFLGLRSGGYSWSARREGFAGRPSVQRLRPWSAADFLRLLSASLRL